MVDCIRRDAREEEVQLGYDICFGVDARPWRTVRFVLLVCDDDRAGEIELILVQCGFWCVRHEIAIYTRLHHIAVLTDELIGSGTKCRVGDIAHAREVGALTANSRCEILPECFCLVVTSAWVQTRTDDVCLIEELICVASVSL